MRRLVFLLMALCASQPAPAADPAREFDERMRGTYTFEPRNVPVEQLREKSEALDRFWAFVRGNRRETLPMLRKALAGKGPTPFFHFDGARLLLDLSDSEADRRLALMSIGRSDPRGLIVDAYVALVHSLASRDRDASDAALDILKLDEFEIAIPVHPGGIPMWTQLLNRESAVLCILSRTREETYVAKAFAMLRVETDPAKQKALATLLWFAATPEADRALDEFAQQAGLPEETRKGVSNLRALTQQLSSLAEADRPPESSAELRERRREAIGSISVEGMEEYVRLTYRLRAAR